MHRLVLFQAEDGIRDIGVTGVQTCALPISSGFLARGIVAWNPAVIAGVTIMKMISSTNITSIIGVTRSEERRVGKECRSRGSPHHLKKKKDQLRSRDRSAALAQHLVARADC